MAAPTSPLLAPLHWVIDQVAARVTGRPASVRWDGAPLDLLRGRARLLTIGVEDLRIAGLTVNKGIVRIENARINPSLEPRLTGGPVTAKLTVEQERVDEWIGRASLPFRLELTDEGIVSSAGVGPLRMGKVLTEVAVREDGALRLRPIKAVGRTLPAGLGEALTGSLPAAPAADRGPIGRDRARPRPHVADRRPRRLRRGPRPRRPRPPPRPPRGHRSRPPPHHLSPFWPRNVRGF